MSVCPDFSSVHPHQIKTVAWRFAAPGDSYLPTGIAMSGSPTIDVTDLNGVDTNPGNILMTTPTVGTFPGDPPNTSIIVKLGRFVAGAYYLFDVYGPSSDGDEPEAVNHMKCNAPG